MLFGGALLCAALAFASPLTLTAGAATPARLPASDYAVHSTCAAPTPGHAGCLSLMLVPRAAAAQARVHPFATGNNVTTGATSAAQCTGDYGSTCLTPANLRSAYFPATAPESPSSEPLQTIALVDAYNDLNAQEDLNTYSSEFGLPACTSENGCFTKINEDGSTTPSSLPFPKTKTELEGFAKGSSQERVKAEEAEGWALETATDIEIAHAVCQNCHILLVEAGSPAYPQLKAAENAAVAGGAGEISNSWGGEEEPSDSSAFNHPGIPITAAAGDNGYLNWDQYATREQAGSPYFEGPDYPASSPHVISVGGTQLNLGSSGQWQSETPWNAGEGAGGGGCSKLLAAPEWQLKLSDWASVGCAGKRASADIAADADPSTGVDVYDSTPYPYEEENGKKIRIVWHWLPIGGTSVASPIVASMYALAGGGHNVPYPAQTLYKHLGSTALHDVTTGGNGECDGKYLSCTGSISALDCGQGSWICNATAGYDGPTGVGTPNGIGAFTPAANEGETQGKGSEGEGSKGGSENPPKEGSKGETGSPKGSENPSGGGETGKGLEGPSGAAGSGTSTTTGTPSNIPPVGDTSPPASTPSAPGHKTRTPRVSALSLTPRARAALERSNLHAGWLAFSFKLSSRASVRVTLQQWTGTPGTTHGRWLGPRASMTFTAVAGLNRRSLPMSGRLSPGLYRVLIMPAHGTAETLMFRVHF